MLLHQFLTNQAIPTTNATFFGQALKGMLESGTLSEGAHTRLTLTLAT